MIKAVLQEGKGNKKKYNDCDSEISHSKLELGKKIK